MNNNENTLANKKENSNNKKTPRGDGIRIEIAVLDVLKKYSSKDNPLNIPKIIEYLNKDYPLIMEKYNIKKYNLKENNSTKNEKKGITKE